MALAQWSACARATQLSTFIYYGNLFVGKLLEAKHLGRSTITDVGTTYKLCRREALAHLRAPFEAARATAARPRELEDHVVSGTHVVSSSVVGVGAGRRRWRRIRWAVVSELGLAWLTTIPATAALGAAALGIWRLVT